MAFAVEMPKMSDTMQEGILVNWLVEEGAPVQAGDAIAQVETDKATIDCEVYNDGILLKQVVAEGDRVPVGQLVAVLGQPGEDITEVMEEYEQQAEEDDASKDVVAYFDTARGSLHLSFTWVEGEPVDPFLQEAADQLYAQLPRRDRNALSKTKRRKVQKEIKQAIADAVNTRLQKRLDELSSTLRQGLETFDVPDWDEIKAEAHTAPRPEPPEMPAAPDPPRIPREPREFDPDYEVDLRFIDRLIPSRQEEKEREAWSRFRHAHEQWTETKDAILKKHQDAQASYEREIDRRNAVYTAEVEAWQRDRKQAQRRVEEARKGYQEKEPHAVEAYCRHILTRSSYPLQSQQQFELEYLTDTGTLIIDYQLPARADLPTLEKVSYVQTRDNFDEKHLADRKANKLYDDLLYQITLRTVYELFGADRGSAIDAIVFNGYVNSVDPATGQEVNPCVLSLQTSKDEYMVLNLDQVDPKACFKKLKGVGSSKLHSMTPVAPVMMMSRDDSRFTDSRAVAVGIQEGDNLAAMDWEDFEHLIRELFEQEFSRGEVDVRVTRASRDGGVDAIAFDPDPIRGGKIVIQAKRYTNTVGVAAVRDLYGTVMNEGANKGILVTTSDYGPDAYGFAKDKPITLLNGGNLLNLLEKHGHKARIDINEAKRLN